MFMIRLVTVAAAALVVFSASFAEADNPEASAVRAAADAFHAALADGDCSKAMQLLAPDAVILESGSMQTRSEYEREHLFEDIAFAQSVRSDRSLVAVQIEGNTAWLTSTSRTKGSFRGREINSTGTELLVLSKSAQGWRIRAIHWSSHEAKEK